MTYLLRPLPDGLTGLFPQACMDGLPVYIPGSLELLKMSAVRLIVPDDTSSDQFSDLCHCGCRQL